MDTDILNLFARIHEQKGHQNLYLRQKPAELERLVEIEYSASREPPVRYFGNRGSGDLETGIPAKRKPVPGSQ